MGRFEIKVTIKMEFRIIMSITNTRVGSLLSDMLIFTLVATFTAWPDFSISVMLLMAEHSFKNDFFRTFYVGQMFSAQEGPRRVEKGNLPS